MKIVKKYQYGGPSYNLAQRGQQSAVEAAENPMGDNSWKYLVPVIGTTQSMIDAFDSGNGFDYGIAGLSLLGDMFTGGFTKGAIGSAKKAYKAYKAGNGYLYKAVKPGLKQAQRDLVENGEKLKAIKEAVENGTFRGTEEEIQRYLQAYDRAYEDAMLGHELRGITPQHHLQDIIWQLMPIVPSYTPHILEGIRSVVDKNVQERKKQRQE